MPLKQKFAFGVATLLVACSAAQAEPNRGGGTVYPVRVTAAPPAPPASVTAVVSPKPTKRMGGARRRDVKVAVGPIETTPSPTPKPAVVTSGAAPTDTPAKDGPHEQPAPTIDALITKHAKENGVPPALASAVVRIESRFNPKARGGGAIGLMQIQVGTARSKGFSGGVAGLFEPETNLHFGMIVLGDAFKASHGDVCMTLARYQSGHLVTHMSAANRVYCARARSIMAKA